MQGRLLEAREWLDRIPRATIDADVDLKLVASWVRSIGETHADAFEVANTLRLDPGLTPLQRFVAARAAFTATMYGDRPGPLPEIVQSWEQARSDADRPIDDPIEATAHANAHACVALHAGETRRVRALVTRLPPGLDPHSAPLPMAHRLMLIGVTYVQDGDAFRAEAVLAPALASYERSQGRRGMVASSFAAALAAAWFDSDRVPEAEALLAYRMDVIDRTAVPDLQLLAYRTLSRIALARGDERRALLLLDELTSLAEAREYPRLAMHALVERIRIHALQARHGIVDGLLRELDAMAPTFDEFDWLAFRPRYIVQRAIANVYAALARNDMDAAAAHLEATNPFLTRARPTRDGLTVEVLRAVIARRQRDPNAIALLTEARDLARLAGWERLLVETHPFAVQMGAELDADTRAQAPEAPAAPRPQRPERRTALRGGLLTMKEAEILALLDKGMSNKAIARAMEISHETVKWHIKNLSLKLSAGTRKHAVDRARLLGLLVH
jgi:LuxR family maltose regulon positive regulatory protein